MRPARGALCPAPIAICCTRECVRPLCQRHPNACRVGVVTTATHATVVQDTPESAPDAGPAIAGVGWSDLPDPAAAACSTPHTTSVTTPAARGTAVPTPTRFRTRTHAEICRPGRAGTSRSRRVNLATLIPAASGPEALWRGFASGWAPDLPARALSRDASVAPPVVSEPPGEVLAPRRRSPSTRVTAKVAGVTAPMIARRSSASRRVPPHDFC